MNLTHLEDQRGFAMVTAIVLMALMLGLGIAALGLTDSESGRTREQRVRESAFQLDEGVLYAQSLVLSNTWASAAAPYPASCTSGGAASDMCPSAANLAGASGSNFSNVDQLASSSWVTKVRDNGGALKGAYDPLRADETQSTPGLGACPGPCTYDFNQDNEVWVQAQSTVRGKPRNVAARLRREKVSESMLSSAVTAGALSITNNGGHGGTALIDGGTSSVLVRCSNASKPSCVDAKPGQIVPAATSGTPPNLMTASQLARFKQTAIDDLRYYPGCPTTSAGGGYNLSGAVVWIEGCVDPPNLANKVQTVACSPPAGMAGQCSNVDEEPGIVIWHCGRADMEGSWTHRGLLYMVNNSDGTCAAGLPTRGDGTCSSSSGVDNTRDVLNMNGGFGVWGAVASDGPACLKVGSNGMQVVFDANAFSFAASYGTVGLVQNTWRELAPKAA
jgi:hypothetical protein